jgi:hypothetical protein
VSSKLPPFTQHGEGLCAIVLKAFSNVAVPVIYYRVAVVNHMVLVFFLPARAPEWNTIELMWNCLCHCLKYFGVLTLMGSHRVVAVAVTILNEITHEEIYHFYQKSGVFDLHGHKR